MNTITPDPVDPDRWSHYANALFRLGIARHAYNNWLYHSTSLGYMLKAQPPPARVLSVGCGPAMLDILLAAYGYEVTSLDSDPKVLESVRQSMQRFDVKLDVRQGDAFDLHEFYDSYDIAFSSGLVEHWKGTRAVELIAQHARCAPRVQIEVPTRHTLLMDNIPEVVEDMHLFAPGEFAAQFRKAGLHVEKVYSVGGVPTRAREIVENLVPPVLFRRIQRVTGYAMAVGCIASRAGG